MEERLTERDWHDAKIKDVARSLGANYERAKLKKLWELENGLEDGTIVKLRCKVGDVLYRVDIGGNVVQGEVGMLQCLKDGRWKFRFIYKLRSYSSKSSYDEYCDKIGETYFFTCEEAKKKLEELIKE